MMFLLICDLSWNTEKELKEFGYDNQIDGIIAELDVEFDAHCNGNISINQISLKGKYLFILVDCEIESLTEMGKDAEADDISWIDSATLNIDFISAIYDIIEFEV